LGALIVGVAGILIGGVAQSNTVLDITPDRRNRFRRPTSIFSGSSESGCR
jgi:hypothetical protein